MQGFAILFFAVLPALFTGCATKQQQPAEESDSRPQTIDAPQSNEGFDSAREAEQVQNSTIQQITFTEIPLESRQATLFESMQLSRDNILIIPAKSVVTFMHTHSENGPKVYFIQDDAGLPEGLLEGPIE